MAKRKPVRKKRRAPAQKDGYSYCNVPQVAEREFAPSVDPMRASLIRVMEDKWVNETTLHYYFFTTAPWAASRAQQDVVRKAFDGWKTLGGRAQLRGSGFAR